MLFAFVRPAVLVDSTKVAGSIVFASSRRISAGVCACVAYERTLVSVISSHAR